MRQFRRTRTRWARGAAACAALLQTCALLFRTDLNQSAPAPIQAHADALGTWGGGVRGPDGHVARRAWEGDGRIDLRSVTNCLRQVWLLRSFPAASRMPHLRPGGCMISTASHMPHLRQVLHDL